MYKYTNIVYAGQIVYINTSFKFHNDLFVQHSNTYALNVSMFVKF